MQTPSPDDYYQAMALFDLGYTRLWLVVVLAMTAVYVIARRQRRHIPVMPTTLPKAAHDTFWLWLLPLALLLRLPLMFRSLWYDETFTAAMVNTIIVHAGDSSQFLQALMGDVHPPLHYLLVTFFSIGLGNSEFALRLPSLIAGLLIICAVYQLALHITLHTRAAQLAALFVAVLPAAVAYSTEARYPVLLALMVCLALLAVLERHLWRYAIAATMLGWLHWHGMVFTAVLMVASALYHRQPRWILVQVVPAFFSSTILGLMILQSSDVADGFWLVQYSPLWTVVDMTITRGGTELSVLISYPILMVLTILSIIAVARNWQQPKLLLVASVMVGVPLLIYAVSMVWYPVYLSRSLIAPAMLLVVIWSWWLARVRRRQKLYYALVALGIAVNLPHLYVDEDSMRDVFARCAGADYTYTTNTHMAIIARYYAPSEDVTRPDGNDLGQELPPAARAAMGLQEVDINDLNGDVCLVSMLAYYTTEPELEHINNLIMSSSYSSTASAVEIIEVNQLVSYIILRYKNE